MFQKTLILFIIATIFTACTNHQVETDLTPEQEKEQQENIKKYQTELDNYDPETSKLTEVILIQSIANAYQMLGDYDEAIEYNQQILDQDPQDIAANKNLAVIYEDLEEYTMSLQYLGYLHANLPDNISIMKDYIRVLVKDQQFEEARSVLIQFGINYQNEENTPIVNDQYSFIERFEIKAAEENSQ